MKLLIKQRKVTMDELKWALLTEIQGRMEADVVKSYLEAEGIEVELFQEAIGHHIYPVTIDGLGRVQVFVSKKQLAEAKKVVVEYTKSKQGDWKSW